MPSKVELLASRVREDIRQGRLMPGSRLPAERALASDHGVSRVTARAAVELLIEEGVVYRERGCRPSVCDVPGLAVPQTPRILALHRPQSRYEDDLHPPASNVGYHWWITQWHEGMGRGIGGRDVQFECRALPWGATLPAWLAELDDGLPDGLLIHNFRVSDDEVRWLRNAGVAVAAMVPPQGRLHISYADIDNCAGMYQTVRYLLERGRKRIALPGVGSQWHAEDQLKGYRRAHAERRLQPDPDWVVPAGRPKQVADAACRLVRESGCDAVIVQQRLSALEVFKRFRAEGIRIPDDVSVIVYNDFPGLEHMLNPSPTCVRQPIDDVAEAAMHLLLEAVEDPSAPVVIRLIPPVLIQRGSA